MRTRKFSDFLERERQALARRREILDQNEPKSYLPPFLLTEDNLIGSSTDNRCVNETFATQAELAEAGYDLAQCSPTGPDCQKDCTCQIVLDEVCENQGRSCPETREKCEQIEEEVCGEFQADNAQKVRHTHNGLFVFCQYHSG